MAPDNPMTTPGIIWRSDDLTTPIEGWRGTLEIRAGSAVDSTTGPLAELARLRAENERLKAEIATTDEEWRRLDVEVSHFAKLAEDRAAENERLKADAADAARYRWIKRGASFREERDMGPGGCWSIFVAVPRRPAVNSLDTAIDAAMAQGKL